MRTKAIMAANSYKKMYGDKETFSNVSIMSLRSLVPDSKHVKCCVTFASGLKISN